VREFRDHTGLILGANHLTSEGGGGLGDFEKNILQVHMGKKKFPAQDYCPKKNSRTYSELENNSGKMLPGVTH